MLHYVACAVLGLIAGFASALLGIGGGVLLVPALVLLFALPAKAASATSLAYIGPVALAGAVLQWRRGEDIRWMLVLLAVPAGLVGAQLGTVAKAYVSNTHLKIAFGLLMVVVGVKLGLAGWSEMRDGRTARAQSIEAPAPPAAEDSP
jgi:uncharacterized membrane protein YfcA